MVASPLASGRRREAEFLFFSLMNGNLTARLQPVILALKPYVPLIERCAAWQDDPEISHCGR